MLKDNGCEHMLWCIVQYGLDNLVMTIKASVTVHAEIGGWVGYAAFSFPPASPPVQIWCGQEKQLPLLNQILVAHSHLQASERPSGTGIWHCTQLRKDQKVSSENHSSVLDKRMCFHLLSSCSSGIPVLHHGLKFPEGLVFDLHTWVCAVGFLLLLGALWPA